jgi:hypothetical protein
MTSRVSVDSSGVQANDVSFEPSFSGDGRYVAFGSFAANLVSNDGNMEADVFVHRQDILPVPPTPTPTITPTATATATQTSTNTPTATSTPIYTPTPTSTATFTPTVTLTVAPTSTSTATFADVSVGYWAWQQIETLYATGVTGGCGTSPLMYCPESPVTRAQMAVFLERSIHGSSYTPPAIGSSTGFADVPATYWAAAWIKQLSAEGITAGCGGNNYCPESPVTRAQMAVFLLRAKYGAAYTPPDMGDSTGFGDVPANYWSASWIKQLAAEGITGGCGSGNYCPDTPVTRAQMAVFLVRTFSLP